MDMKRCMLIWFFISMLVNGWKEWSSYKMDVILKKGGQIVIKKVNEKKEVVFF